MRFYKHLYMGEKAKQKRFVMIQRVRHNRFSPGMHVITPASGERCLLDILPASALASEHYKKQKDLLILGIGASYGETLELAGRMISDMYRKTGTFRRDFFTSGESGENREI